MYIPEFWVGVILTLLVEITAVLIMSAWASYKKVEKEDKDYEDSFNKGNK